MCTGSPRCRSLKTNKFVCCRDFIQFLRIPVADTSSYDDNELHFDPEWCAILRKTHEELSQTRFMYRSAPAAVTPEVSNVLKP